MIRENQGASPSAPLEDFIVDRDEGIREKSWQREHALNGLAPLNIQPSLDGVPERRDGMFNKWVLKHKGHVVCYSLVGVGGVISESPEEALTGRMKVREHYACELINIAVKASVDEQVAQASLAVAYSGLP